MTVRSGSGTINNSGVFYYAWTGLTNGDSGTPLDASKYVDKNVQAIGTWGSGGTCIIEGSNDGGTTWSQLHDHAGNAFSLSSTTPMDLVAESPLLIRPRVTAGDGTTSLKVVIVASRGRG